MGVFLTQESGWGHTTKQDHELMESSVHFHFPWTTARESVLRRCVVFLWACLVHEEFEFFVHSEVLKRRPGKHKGVRLLSAFGEL